MYRSLKSLRQGAALAACIVLGIGAAIAVERESIEVRIAAGADAEVIHIDDLAIGESRQLTTESGKPVTVVREAEALLIDIDGEPHEIRLPDPQGGGKGFAFVTSKDHRVVLMDADGSGKAQVRIDGTPGAREVVIVRRHGEGEQGKQVRIVHAGEAIDVAALMEGIDMEDGEARRIVVKRRIVRDSED
ncbi:MAG TPA: hypothetical protein PKZ76_10950 [Xanthomonadaceae bacterium]|nr:hypothetical protein [Xanthomonadaceae bacterium]